MKEEHKLVAKGYNALNYITHWYNTVAKSKVKYQITIMYPIDILQQKF